jgi:hypothetical protein
MSAAIYRKRRNMLEKGEYEWRVEEDALVGRDAQSRQRRFRWSDVTGVRISFVPTRASAGRHALALRFRRGIGVEIDNMHYRGLADFEDRTESYLPFARAALARIAVFHPHMPVRIGSGRFSYYAQLITVIALFLLLIVVIVFLPIPPSEWSELSWIRFFVILALLPVFLTWVKHARPRMARLDSLPPDVFPNG